MNRQGIISSVEFHVLSADDIRSQSVVEVTETSLYRKKRPLKNSLMDLRMGTHMRLPCKTCFQTSRCPGHPGHIELNRPVYHPIFLNAAYSILKSVCHWCSVPIEGKKVCENCGGCMGKMTKKAGGGINALTATYPDPECPPMTPQRAYDILSNVDTEWIENNWGYKLSSGSDLMIKALVVPPICIRPTSFDKHSGPKGEDITTTRLLEIIRENNEVARDDFNPIHWDNMQQVINSYMDRDRGVPRMGVGGGKSLANRLKGKKGRLRANVMGKRVNFSARTVIGPDASIDVEEVGVPFHICTQQTIPVHVNDINRESIKKAVIIGANKMGGALCVSVKVLINIIRRR